MPLLTLCNITHVNTKYSEISTELMIVNIMTGFVSVEKISCKTYLQDHKRYAAATPLLSYFHSVLKTILLSVIV